MKDEYQIWPLKFAALGHAMIKARHVEIRRYLDPRVM
jgi:hypothetical protein